MSNFAKWAWMILLIVLFMGGWVFAVLIFYVVLFFLLSMFKPEWLKKFF